MINPTFQLEQLRLEDPVWTSLIWIAVFLGAFGILVAYRRIRRASRFTDDALRNEILGKSRTFRPTMRASCATVSAALLAFAAARPQANPHTIESESRGRDLVFLVDVSRSMLARDVAPNRLERSKLWIKDLVANLRGDRVALVAFAGSSSVQCPLTTDRLFFDLALDELSPESAGIGGTNIGDAIRRILTLLYPDASGEDLASHRDIILITDGEDQNSLPVEAAKLAGSLGVRIIALGIGSESGAVVVDKNNAPVQRAGNDVRTSLDSVQLTKIASATPGGVYLNVGTGDIDLAQVYRDIIESADDAALESSDLTTWDELYPYAAIAALLFILIELLLGARSPWKASRPL